MAPTAELNMNNVPDLYTPVLLGCEPEQPGCPLSHETTPMVVLAWATQKRHIAVNGHVLCQYKGKTAGYSVRTGKYNSLSLNGLPTHDFRGDRKTSHDDGIIQFLPLSAQAVPVIPKSICVKCQAKYSRLLEQAGPVART